MSISFQQIGHWLGHKAWGGVGAMAGIIAVLLAIYFYEVAAPPTTSGIIVRITTPVNGSSVGASEIVRGDTTKRDLNHYLVVIPLQTGDRYVVDGPLSIKADNSWSARARFGKGSVGIGKRFAVHVLVTNLEISEGPLSNLPGDAETSDSVEVVRVK